MVISKAGMPKRDREREREAWQRRPPLIPIDKEYAVHGDKQRREFRFEACVPAVGGSWVAPSALYTSTDGRSEHNGLITHQD